MPINIRQLANRIEQEVPAIKLVAAKLNLRAKEVFSDADADVVASVFALAAQKGIPSVEAAERVAATQQQGAQAADFNTVGAVTGEFSAYAQQQQAALMRQEVEDATQRQVIRRVADNLAIAQLEASGWNLESRPDLQAMLNQSQQVRQTVEAVNPTLLPFTQMITIAFKDVPMLNGKLSMLPSAEPLALAGSEPTHQPTN